MLKIIVLVYLFLLLFITVGFLVAFYHIARYRFPKKDYSLTVGALFLLLMAAIMAKSLVYILTLNEPIATIPF